MTDSTRAETRHAGGGSEARIGSDGEGAALAELEAAIDRVESVEHRIEALGEDEVDRGADAYRRARDLLDRNDDRAVGTGREAFAAYVQFEAQFDNLLENLDSDLAEFEAFEAAYEAIDKRRLYDEDFERAKTALEPAERYVDLLDEREDAEGGLYEARTAANRRLGEIADERDRLDRLEELAAVDLDAPVDRIREPIEAYNDAVETAFVAYLSSVSAREVFALLERSRLYPLVDFDRPPVDLREFVESNPAGESTVTELLEYAEYSRSKLAHHVDDPDELKRQVATQQTSLRRLDAEPLTIPWPPAPAAELRYQVRERRPLVERIAESDVELESDLLVTLRAVAELTYEDSYDRLQTAATAREEVSERERERIEDGRVEDEIDALETERERLESALDRADDLV